MKCLKYGPKSFVILFTEKSIFTSHSDNPYLASKVGCSFFGMIINFVFNRYECQDFLFSEQVFAKLTNKFA